MLVSASYFHIQVHSTTYRSLKVAVNFIPVSIIWIILIVAALFAVRMGHHRRSLTPAMSGTGCFKTLAKFARNFMTIIDAFYRSRIRCGRMLVPSMAQASRVQPGEIVRREREILVPWGYLQAGSEDQTRKATLLHSRATVLEIFGPVRGTWLGVVEESALIARWHVLGEATLLQTPRNTDAFPELESCQHFEILNKEETLMGNPLVKRTYAPQELTSDLR